MTVGFPGELCVVDDVPGAFAQEVIRSFADRPLEVFSLALTGGETARRCYERLATEAVERIDWWKVDVYWTDERCVPHDHPDSNYRLAREALLDRVGAANATHLMRCGEGADPYQLRLGDLGSLDLVHLGLATDGHTAALFAGSEALDADPGRLVAMNEDPTGTHREARMTLTLGGIERARRVVVTVAGEAHAQAVAAVAAGADVPASRLSGDQIIWLVDDAAASALG